MCSSYIFWLQDSTFSVLMYLNVKKIPMISFNITFSLWWFFLLIENIPFKYLLYFLRSFDIFAIHRRCLQMAGYISKSWWEFPDCRAWACVLNTLFFLRIFRTVDCFLNGTNELFLEISALTLDEASRLGRGRDRKQRKKQQS